MIDSEKKPRQNTGNHPDPLSEYPEARKRLESCADYPNARRPDGVLVSTVRCDDLRTLLAGPPEPSDAADAAERDVGRYLYNRLEALVYAGVKCPEMDWIARVIESVEEYGASHCGSDELATFPAPPSKDTAGG